MRWKPGDKCVLDEAVFSRLIKSFGSETHREPEVYVVVDTDPTQAVVIIADKGGRASLVLESWILPAEEQDWQACKQILEKSSSPIDLVKRLNAPETAEHSKEEPPAPPNHLPDSRKALTVTLDQLDVALSASVRISMAILKVFLLRHW